jgi:hypothetical protein
LSKVSVVSWNDWTAFPMAFIRSARLEFIRFLASSQTKKEFLAAAPTDSVLDFRHDETGRTSIRSSLPRPRTTTFRPASLLLHQGPKSPLNRAAHKHDQCDDRA